MGETRREILAFIHARAGQSGIVYCLSRRAVEQTTEYLRKHDLFERLRSLRKELADAQGVPAYIVFNDSTLRALAESRPTSAAELLEVPGVGPARLERVVHSG